MPLANARYAHTNLIAIDWRRLASFYERVFGCVRVPPERDQQGAWLDRGTGLAGAHLRGVHLRLPGHGATGPTLEIYSYEQTIERGLPAPNMTGLGHLAFGVDDVAQAVDLVAREGGSLAGEIVEVDVPGAGRLTFTYARDPEGNLIELQTWRQTP